MLPIGPELAAEPTKYGLSTGLWEREEDGYKAGARHRREGPRAEPAHSLGVTLELCPAYIYIYRSFRINSGPKTLIMCRILFPESEDYGKSKCGLRRCDEDTPTLRTCASHLPYRELRNTRSRAHAAPRPCYTPGVCMCVCVCVFVCICVCVCILSVVWKE